VHHCTPSPISCICQDGKIWCPAFPHNTTSLIHPIVQGVRYACKRTYKKKFLDEVTVIIKMGNNEEEGRRGQRTLQYLKN
jgi:hypothetical protein